MTKLTSVIKKLRAIYPLTILLLANYAMLVGLLINYSLVDSREFAINLVWLTLFLVPIHLLAKPRLFKVFTAILFLFALIDTIHWILMDGPLTLTSLLVLSATNFKETNAFLSITVSWKILFLVPLFYIGYIALRSKFEHQKRNKSTNWLLLVMGLIVLIFIAENTINGRLIRKGTPNLVQVVATYVQKMSLYKEVAIARAPKTITVKAKNEDQTIVVVIGESCNRNHMGLYNKALETTPLLQQQKELIVFNDVISAYSNTIAAVLTSLSERNIDSTFAEENVIDLIDVYHSAGYETYWLSNQTPVGVWENLVTIFANKADHTIFVNTTSNSSFEATLSNSYDEKLLHPLEKILDNEVTKKIIFVHLMGSHTAYANRYPSEFDYFNSDTNEEKTVATYHNSIYYSDFVLNEMIEIVRSAKLNASLVYYSDHGENVFDEPGKLGHAYTGTLPHSHVEIPLFMRFSDQFQQKHPKIVHQAKTNVNNPFSNDRLFHTLVNLGQIKYDGYLPAESLVSKDFQPMTNRKLEDGRRY